MLKCVDGLSEFVERQMGRVRLWSARWAECVYGAPAISFRVSTVLYSLEIDEVGNANRVKSKAFALGFSSLMPVNMTST